MADKPNKPNKLNEPNKLSFSYLMIEIKYLSDADRDRWDAYVRSHPDGTLFHLISWKTVIEKTFRHKSHYLLAMNGQSVAGLLPLFRIRSLLFGDYLVSVPFAEVGGILADDSTAAHALLDRAADNCVGMGCEYLELRNQSPLSGDLVAKSLYYNFKKKISADDDENLKAIPRKARRMVRQGMKKGLTAAFGQHQLPTFYDLMATNFHRLGTPIFSKKFFINFIETFREASSVMIVSDPEGVPIAGVLSFYYKDTVMPYYAGSLFEYRRLAPNDFMYWELMRDGAARGYRRFDFGRSKSDTGSYHFKRHWGFEPKPLHYQYRLNRIGELPNLSPANPKYRKKIEMWRKLPLWATRMIGPPIAKYLA